MTFSLIIFILFSMSLHGPSTMYNTGCIGMHVHRAAFKTQFYLGENRAEYLESTNN